MTDKQFDALITALNGIATELAWVRINLGDISRVLQLLRNEND